ncbi:hypothetical protein [Nocardioides sp. W7]|uniref:hypothetical protein n=1 Tax=Nocardioides sp. W7 TaxID=2931390 RepID=UPI001FD0CC9E|nr:hypothetical protein [Nocardioides sp. W7]
MLRFARSLATVIGAASGIVVMGAVLESAAACGGGGISCEPPQVDGSTVTVTVTGSFVSGGSPGSPGGGTTTVHVPVPCVFYEGWTGKEYFEGVKEGSISGAGSDEADRGEWKPYAGYQQHKDDTEGHWYFAGCQNVNDLPWDDFEAFAENFFDTHDGVYVEAGGAPPVPPVPPEVLLMAAQQAMTIPEPAFEFNPDAAGAFDTLVNLDTWFWLSDPAQSGSVTATAGTNSVTVEAALADVVFSAPDAGAVPCAGTGVAWQPGGSSECVLAFRRAGTAEVTADTQWTVSWTFNGQPQGEVDPLSARFTQSVGVAESQSLVTAVG